VNDFYSHAKDKEACMFNFKNQVVMLTGATGNLGIVLAHSYQESQAKLALVDRGEDRLRQTFPDLAHSPDYLLVNCADLMNEGEVEAAVAESVQHFGRIDVLVNTVGGFRAGLPLHETEIKTWDFLINLNARSVFIACQKVIPQMLKQGSGKIINIAARPGLQGRAGMAAYSASKSAVLRLTESMAAELKEYNINVNCVIPGTIDTPQNRETMPDGDYSTWVNPESLADITLFLTSDLARDVHGAALPVYGKS
jgi:NAD(P)-dependent dehydrogenase (short-subunit alcohol dehydrogenase family)